MLFLKNIFESRATPVSAKPKKKTARAGSGAGRAALQSGGRSICVGMLARIKKGAAGAAGASMRSLAAAAEDFSSGPVRACDRVRLRARQTFGQSCS